MVLDGKYFHFICTSNYTKMPIMRTFEFHGNKLDFLKDRTYLFNSLHTILVTIVFHARKILHALVPSREGTFIYYWEDQSGFKT